MLKKIKLYYDEECPFCNEYSKYVELRKKYDIKIFNARESIDKIKVFRNKGFDINDGMIIECESKIFQGSDAVKIIDKYIDKKRVLDQFISVIINLPGFKLLVYPIVKFLRIMILKLLGRNSKINY
tara:strand:- start:10842 stop:11219 length:378 start_codon:yes stop_codon:yes gene_type:complete